MTTRWLTVLSIALLASLAVGPVIASSSIALPNPCCRGGKCPMSAPPPPCCEMQQAPDAAGVAEERVQVAQRVAAALLPAEDRPGPVPGSKVAFGSHDVRPGRLRATLNLPLRC